jgi:hypothetical protein
VKCPPLSTKWKAASVWAPASVHNVRIPTSAQDEKARKALKDLSSSLGCVLCRTAVLQPAPPCAQRSSLARALFHFCITKAACLEI